MLTLDTIIITGVGVVADLILGGTEMNFIEMGLTGFYVINILIYTDFVVVIFMKNSDITSTASVNESLLIIILDME